MKYNKLVRDKIPERIRAKGEAAKTHVADEQEYWQKLKEKLSEEVQEFAQAESIEELADILEVIDAIVAHKRFDRGEIENMKREKRQGRGGFAERIILDES